MSKEYLDLVDEDNKPLGEKEVRSVVHSTGLWHRTVHIYFFRENGGETEFLVHLRSDKKDLHPNCWDTRFGGHIKAGENIGEGAENEIHEETGLNVSLSDLLDGGWRKTENYPNNEFNQVYYFEFKGKTRVLKFNDGEVQEVKWIFASEIMKLMKESPDTWTGSSEAFGEIIEGLKKV